MDWRAKVELFEQIRRELEFGIGTIQGVAWKFGVHRRMMREALANARPAHRKKPERKTPRLAAALPFIDEILEGDRRAPRKERPTARNFRCAQQAGRKSSRIRSDSFALSIAFMSTRQFSGRLLSNRGGIADGSPAVQ